MTDNVIQLRPAASGGNRQCERCGDQWVNIAAVFDSDDQITAFTVLGKCASCGVERTVGPPDMSLA